MTIDEELLRELGDQPLTPTFRPPAEIAARARTLRRRRTVARTAGLAGATAVAAALTLVLGPSDDAPPPQPAVPRAAVPIAPECPAPGGPELRRDQVRDLLVLPPEATVTALEARSSDSGCQMRFGGGAMPDPRREVTEISVFVEPSQIDAWRPPGVPVPGRHETRTWRGVEVDIWVVDEPVRQYRAYWTNPKNCQRYGAHAENSDPQLRWLKSTVEQALRDGGLSSEMAKLTCTSKLRQEEPIRYVTTTLRLAGGSTVTLQVNSTVTDSFGPRGARQVYLAGDEEGFWFEEDGVGRLDWLHRSEAGGTRSVWGRGLTLERAKQIAASLTPVAPDDPRLPPA